MKEGNDITEIIIDTIESIDLNETNETTILLSFELFSKAIRENLLFDEGGKVYLDLGYFPNLQEQGLEQVTVNYFLEN